MPRGKRRLAPPAAIAAADLSGSRIVAAAIGLTLAAVLCPIAVAMVASANARLWQSAMGQSALTSALVGLLVLAPAGVGIAAAWVGLRRIAALAGQAGYAAEHAVLRVFAVAVLLGYALALTAYESRAADCVPLVAGWLVAAWFMLLHVMLRPSDTPLRRHGAIAFDIVLLSVFLLVGGDKAAGCYLLYLVAVCYAGLRFGPSGLAVAAILSILGFGAAVAATASWREQPFLAAGLLGALAVLPALIAGTIRALAAAQAQTAQAEAERQRTLQLIADTLRGPPATTRPSGPATSSVKEVVDFAALESGTFAAPRETFDLRPLVRQSLGPLEAKAGAGHMLRWRIDPRLPYRLRGHAQAFGRILSGLADYGAEAAGAAGVRIAIDGDIRDGRKILLRIRVDGLAAKPDPAPAPGEVPLTLKLVRRLVSLAGGEFAVEPLVNQRTRLIVTLPLSIEPDTARPPPDLQRRPVMIITEDDQLARDAAELLTSWNAEPSRFRDTDHALPELARPAGTRRAIVILDGRDRLLPALGLAGRAARLGRDGPFVLLITEAAQIATLAEVDGGELDGFIPAPLSEELLANALDGLPLEAEPPTMGPIAEHNAAPGPMAARQQPASAVPNEHEAERITAIAAHPKFVPEPATAVDPRAIERLHALGGGPVFVCDVVEAFLADARRIIVGVEEAVAASDPERFARGLLELHRAAGHVGGVQLCELAASLGGLTAAELRRQGATHLQRLVSETDRLAVALVEVASPTASRRS